MSETTKVTSIDELIASANGSIVELPPFTEGTHFYARLRRPSMLSLVRQKKIPNSLLTAANKMFKSGPSSFNSEDDKMMDDLFSIMDIICEASFIEPSWSQLKESGIELTDEQYMFVFGYSQNGVKQLESFRE